MPVTILDCAKARGAVEPFDGETLEKAGFAILGGCQICEATIACYNAYPSKSGYWRCEDCIDDSGFNSTEDFDAFGA